MEKLLNQVLFTGRSHIIDKMIRFKKSTSDHFSDFSVKKNIASINLTGLIMVKNQETNILKAINSIYKYCDDILVVDTGSTDNTIPNVAKYFPDVKVLKLKWKENYAYMRNECLKFISNGWILVLDSDEVFENPWCSSNDLKNFLSYLDEKSKNPVCTLKTENYESNAFTRKRVLFRKNSFIKYHGLVHEELVSIKDNLSVYDTNLELINKGTSTQQIYKFHKPKRYSTLLLKQMKEEPNNPRWVAMMSPDYVNLGLVSRKVYCDKLRQFIFKNKVDDFSENNIQKNKWLKYLLARYAILLMSKGKVKKTIICSKLAMKLFPYDANFLTIFISANNVLNKIKNENTVEFVKKYFEKYTNNIDELDEKSQGTEDSIKPALVKLLINCGQYNKAQQVMTQINNPNYKALINKELKFFK